MLHRAIPPQKMNTQKISICFQQAIEEPGAMKMSNLKKRCNYDMSVKGNPKLASRIEQRIQQVEKFKMKECQNR